MAFAANLRGALFHTRATGLLFTTANKAPLRPFSASLHLRNDETALTENEKRLAIIGKFRLPRIKTLIMIACLRFCSNFLSLNSSLQALFRKISPL